MDPSLHQELARELRARCGELPERALADRLERLLAWLDDGADHDVDEIDAAVQLVIREVHPR